MDVPSDALQLNTWKDSGGNTLFTSDGAGNLSSVNAGVGRGGGPNLILSQTANSSSSISFTSGIDDTYNDYMFVFININPATDGAYFQFQCSTNFGHQYGIRQTSACFTAYHSESGSTSLAYWGAGAKQESVGYNYLCDTQGNGADEGMSGILHLYNPSSETYVKTWQATTQQLTSGNSALVDYVGGYFNIQRAINAIDFQFHSGNINTGTIKMYGVR